MLGIREGRVRQVLGPLRTQQRQAADQQSAHAARVPLVAGEGRLGWMDQAACKGLPTEQFFPETGEGRKATEAKAICAGCGVQAPCRELAVRAADSLESDFGVFGGTVPTERSHLWPNQFPEPSAYQQDRAVAERAHELASRVGLRQAAQELGVSRDTLKKAWAHWNLPQPEGILGSWQAPASHVGACLRDLMLGLRSRRSAILPAESLTTELVLDLSGTSGDPQPSSGPMVWQPSVAPYDPHHDEGSAAFGSIARDRDGPRRGVQRLGHGGNHHDHGVPAAGPA